MHIYNRTNNLPEKKSQPKSNIRVYAENTVISLEEMARKRIMEREQWVTRRPFKITYNNQNDVKILWDGISIATTSTPPSFASTSDAQNNLNDDPTEDSGVPKINDPEKASQPENINDAKESTEEEGIDNAEQNYFCADLINSIMKLIELATKCAKALNDCRCYKPNVLKDEFTCEQHNNLEKVWFDKDEFTYEQNDREKVWFEPEC